MSPRECLPIGQVLETVQRVSRDVVGFYQRAVDLTSDDDVRKVFSSLLTDKQDTEPTLEKVCQSIDCGDRPLEGATASDLDFLSALVETGFYKQVGRVDELADPALRVHHIVDNALKLEKDLMLFYMKFYGTSCVEHRPVFSDLLQRSQKHIAELNVLRRRLDQDR